MKISNYFKRISTVKHKFKIQFAIDTLQMSGTVTEDINVIIKRGIYKIIQVIKKKVQAQEN